MFHPKLPDTPHVPSITTHIPQDHAPAPSAGRPIAPFVGVGVGAVTAVVAVGVVLTALLAAVAVSAVSVAIAAVVLRSLVNGSNKR
ncbi:SpdD protein [Streptomyces spinoverrucosus]|uniref:SpdD protein n=1 Tax=Streptomyces spinoverrucosus TaxID=284043 RepID=UPI0018C38F1D|nr:SpdD protein [Streptomyces spinoverrucosus]MBG0853712.1 SpdD protein [Streptomyces spinoverrucosus]